MMLLAAAAPWDGAPSPAAECAAALVLLLPVLALAVLLALALARRLRRPLARLACRLRRLGRLEILSDAPAVRLARALAALKIRLEDVLDPEGKEYRALGRYLLALPLRSGLTEYEENLREAESLPPALRADALRAVRRYGRRPAAAEIDRARRAAGLRRVDSSVLAALLAGREPYAWKMRRLRRERALELMA